MPRQPCGDSLLAICLYRQDGVIYRLTDIRQDKKEDLVKQAIILLAVVLLVYCCIHWVAVKSEH